MEHKPITHQVNQHIRNRRLRRRWTRIVACLSAAVLLVTSYMLIHPASTMGGTGMEADRTAAELGESISVTLNATGSGEEIIYLAAYGDNAGLTGVGFDNDSASVSLDGGGSITLNREVISGGVGYWFAMPSGMQSAQLTLRWTNGIGQLLQYEETVVVEPDESSESSSEPSPEVSTEASPEANPDLGSETVPAVSPNPTDEPAESTTVPEVSPMPPVQEEQTSSEPSPVPASEPSPSPAQETDVAVSSVPDSSNTVPESTELEAAVGNETDSAAQNISNSDGSQDASEGSGQSQPVETKTVIYYTEQQGDSSAPGSLSLSLGKGSTLESARSSAFASSTLSLTWKEQPEDQEETSTEEPEYQENEIIPNTENSWATVEKAGFGISSFSAVQATARQADANTKAAGSVDFGQYITAMSVMQNVDGTWQEVSQVTSGDTIRVHISYTIPENVVGPDCRVITYQLPTGIGLNEPATGTVTIGNQAAGTYEISSSGLITITFNEAFADDTAFDGQLEFQGMVTATGESGQDEIQLGADGTTITVIPNVEESGLSIEKTGTYDKASNLVHYVITVSAENGSDGPITITDQFMHDPSYGVINYQTIEKLEKVSADGQTITLLPEDYLSHADQTAEQTAHFTLTNLPALDAGESYVLSYTAEPDLTSLGDGNGYLQFTNVATAEDNSNSVEARANVKVSENMIRKEGDYNSQTGKIQWKIYINEDQRDISGLILEDTLTYTWNGQIYTMTLPDQVQMEIYRDNQPTGETKTIPLPYTFPEGSNAQYLITYETDLPEDAAEGDPISFHNRAQIGDYWIEIDVDGTIPGDYGVVKGFVDSNGTTGIVSWESWVTHPAAVDLEQLRYIDLITDIVIDNTLYSNTHYTTPELLRSTLQLKTVDGTPLVYGTDYSVFAISRASIAGIVPDGDFEAYSAFYWTIINGNFADVTNPTIIPWTDIGSFSSDEPLVAFGIEFTENARTKLNGSASVLINYSTKVDTTKLPAGTNFVQFMNSARIQAGWVDSYGAMTLAEKLDKQVSLTGVNGNDTSSYTDDPLTVSIGDHGTTLHYRILVSDYGDASGITVTDTLPAGAKLVEGSVYLRNHLYGTDQFVGESNDSWYIQYNITDNSDGTSTVTFMISHLDDAVFDGKPIGIYYDVSVKDDPRWETQEEITYTNTASWDGETDGTSTTVKNTRPHLEKTGEQITQDENGDDITDNVLRYYITINPEGDDLNPYTETLTLEDTLTTPAGSGATFQANTAKLYVYDPDNAEGHYCGAPVDVSQYSADYDPETHQITFTIPDKLACVLVYDYLIDYGTAAGDLTISNSVTLSGQDEYHSESDLVLEEQSSSASVNKATVTIYKHDSENALLLLPGAEFLLQRYEEQGDGSYEWEQTSVTAQDPEGHFVVGEDGTIMLSFLSETSRYNTLYKIEEVEPPNGYLISPETYYFVWMENNATQESTIAAMQQSGALENVDPTEIHFIEYSMSYPIYVPNEKDTLTVTKAWKMESGETLEVPPEDSVTVTLYRWIEGEAEKESCETVHLTADNEWTYTWTGLDKTNSNGQKYLYCVEEAPLSGFQVTYENNDGIQIGTIVITNTRHGYVLPETGGTGILHFTIAGWILLGIYVLGSLYQWRKRRKGEVHSAQ